MDVSSCVILYLDRRAGATAELNSQTLSSIHIGDDHAAQNIRTIVSAFGHGNHSSTTSIGLENTSDMK